MRRDVSKAVQPRDGWRTRYGLKVEEMHLGHPLLGSGHHLLLSDSGKGEGEERAQCDISES